MPLEPFRRGPTWWARGRVEYLGAAITDYYRCSTGASEEAGAWDWCRAEEERQIRRHVLGDDALAEPPAKFTFADAVLLYKPSAADAGYLVPILSKFGSLPVADITPKLVRELGEALYPDASTDTWVRHVVTPVRSVINNAHDLGHCAPIRIKGYSKEERVAQDLKRGRKSRVKKTPGSWEWLLKFRQHAPKQHGALAMFMFMTGARISQAIAMHPDRHLKLDENMVCIPAAKGHDDRWIAVPSELVVELASLPRLYPRGFERTAENLRVFGFADRSSPRKGWAKTCKLAGIDLLPFHAAGRHGFGQEMNVRQGIDEKAAGDFGGWSDTSLMRRTYTHAEKTAEKIHEAQLRGLRAAEEKTKLTLFRPIEAKKRGKA
ncbi:tyrosine-type recombinase/integrase [Novosphingobium acidiphilum]|uniref:tyrosine-type recombinase/integrase n=1 Tax=Novosphingobium acidiphilum TaxID=505248 RepID=UPI000491308E|nr:tyrosine-type recombinase/integrase [Novosphingobium acidiphilum]